MKIKNLRKLPKRKVTVSELLRKDDVSEVIDNLVSTSYDIDEIIVITTGEDGTIDVVLSSMTLAQCLGLLELTKDLVIHGGENE